jgi:arabinosyltransferase C
LLLTGSPWPWHMGAVVPAAAVLAAIGASALLARGRAGLAILVAAGVATAIAAVWAMRTTRPWTVGDLADHGWNDLPHLPIWLWLGIASIGAALGVAVTRRQAPRAQQRRGAVFGAAALLVLGPLALTWGLFAVDATATSGWSFTRQAFDEVTGGGTCGVGDFVRVVRAVTPLAETAVATGASVPSAASDAYPASTAAAVVPERSPVWGTYGTRAAGEVATPWFAVRGAHELVFWTLGQTSAPDRVRVEVATTTGARERVQRRAPEPATSTPWWSYHDVQLSSRARAVRVVLTDGTNDDRSWLATTAPFVPRFTSFTAITRNQPVWRNPDVVQAMPCRALPAATDGVYQRFRFSLGAPAHNGTAIAAEYPTIERGCLRPHLGDGAGERFCAFEFVTTARAT